MLPTREPPQDKRPTQTESEGLETNFPNKWTGKKKKKDRVTRPLWDKIDVKKRAIKRDQEGHFLILKGRIHQEHLTLKYISTQHTAPKYIQKILEDFQKKINGNTSIVDFNNPLSKMDRRSSK